MKARIRRWCEVCQRFTESWVDGRAQERCRSCDPPASKNPSED